VQIVRRYAETFRKFNQVIFSSMDTDEPLWYNSKLCLDSIRIV
jgi:hypothetical protein